MEKTAQYRKVIEQLPGKTKDLLFKELLFSDLVGVNITDAAGRTLFLNDAHTRITGHDKEMYMTHTMKELEDMGVIHPSAVVKVLETKEVVRLQQTVSNGRSFEVRGTPVFDDEGNLILVLCVLTDITEIIQSQKTISEIQEYVSNLKEAISNEGQLIYQSRAMHKIVEKARKIAEADVSVLISGPSGVGKEMISDIIQAHSPRKDKPFVKINCAAIPETLLESELFGYEPGAFTGGNSKGKKGLIESANGGTLLLDEIGELPLMLQSKLLRTLQARTIRHLGGTKDIPVDFRLISSTNADLLEMVHTKEFRDDLYYRVNVIEIPIPPLEKRKEDIPLLINHFIKVFNVKYEMDKSIDKDALHFLTEYNYPGNVRELRNIVESLMIQSPGDKITLRDTYDSMDAHMNAVPEGEINSMLISKYQGKTLKEIMEEHEKLLLEEYLKIYRNGSELARQLHTDQSTISRKLNKYGIHCGNGSAAKNGSGR